MTDTNITIGIKGDDSGGKVIKRSLDDVAASAEKATTSVNKVGQAEKKFAADTNSANTALQKNIAEANKSATANEKLARSTKEAGQATNTLTNAMRTLVTYFSFREFARLSDAYTQLSNRLKVISKDTADFGRNLQGIKDIAERTRKPIDDIAGIYTRLSMATEKLNMSQAETQHMTEALINTFRISGATTAEAVNSATQFTQAMSAGALRGDEFRSISEQNVVMMQLLTEKFKDSGQSLKQLAEDGALTAEVMRDVLGGAYDDLRARANSATATIEESVTLLMNSIKIYIGESEKLKSVSSGIQNAFKFVADNFQTFGDSLIWLAEVAIPLLITKGIMNLIKSLNALRLAAMTNPLGLLITALTTATLLIVEYSDEIKKFSKSVGIDLDKVALQFEKDFKRISDVITPALQKLITFLGLGKQTQNFTVQPVNGGNFSVADFGQDFSRTVSQTKSPDLEQAAALFKKTGGTKTTNTIKEQNAALEKQNALYSEMENAVAGARTEQEVLNDDILKLEKMKGMARTATEAAGIEKAIAKSRKELDKLRVDAELDSPLGKAFKSLTGEIEDGFKDAFKSAFSESDGGFKKLMSGFKATFKNMLAEIAYQALARPILVPLIGAAAGAFGLSQGAQASVLGAGGTGLSSLLGGMGGAAGAGGGGFGIGGIASLGSTAMSLFQSGGSFSALGAGGGLINSIGGHLGFATNLPMSGVGPFQSGSIFGGTSLSGAMGGGAIGGLAANLLGLGSGKIVQDTALSIAGTALGSFGGPVGAAVGSFLGTALSGMIGGSKPSDAAAGGRIDLVTGEYRVDQNPKSSSENLSAAAAAAAQATNLTKLLKEFGGTSSGGVNVVVGSRDGLRVRNSAIATETNLGNNANAFSAALNKQVIAQTTGLSTEAQAALSALKDFSSESIATALTSIKTQTQIIEEQKAAQEQQKAVQEQQKAVQEQQKANIKAFEDFLNNLDQEVDPLAGLNAQFAELKLAATGLNLNTDKLTASYEKQKEAILDTVKANKAGFDSMKSLTEHFKQFLDSQQLGAASSLSPTGKLTLAREQFDTNLTAIGVGNLSGVKDLTGQARTLLDIGRDVYASSPAFAALETFVRDAVSNIAKSLDLPGFAIGTSSASSGFGFVGERGREIVNFNGGERVHSAGETAGIMSISGNVARDIVVSNAKMVQAMDAMLAELNAVREENRRMRKSLERVGNSMVAA